MFRSSVGRMLDCYSRGRRFEPYRNSIMACGRLGNVADCYSVTSVNVGSNPTTPAKTELL